MKHTAATFAASIVFVIFFCCACQDRPTGVPSAALMQDPPPTMTEYEPEAGWNISSYCYAEDRDVFHVEVHYPEIFEFVRCSIQSDFGPVICGGAGDYFCVCEYIDRRTTELRVVLTRASGGVAADVLIPAASIVPPACFGDPDAWDLNVTCNTTDDTMYAYFKFPLAYDVTGCEIVDQDGTSYGCTYYADSEDFGEHCSCPGLPRATTDLHPFIILSDGRSVQADVPTVESLIIPTSCLADQPTPTVQIVQGGGQQPGGAQQPVGGGGQQSPATTCADHTDQTKCEGNGCNWWPDGTCHAETQPDCSTFTTKDTCSTFSWCTWDPDASTCK